MKRTRSSFSSLSSISVSLLAAASGLILSLSIPIASSRAETAIVASASSVPAASPEPASSIRAGKIGYVDVDRCFNETEDGLRAKAMLRKITDRRQQALAAVEDRLKAEQESVSQLQQTVGPGPKLTNAALTFQRHYTEYQQMMRQMNLDLSRREDELYAPIEKRVKAIFERIGADDGYDLIVDKKAMPTAKFTLDLTDRVIREYNWGPPGAASASASASVAPKP